MATQADGGDGWKKALEATSDALLQVDREFNIVRVNRAAEKLLGARAGKLVGRKCYAAVHGAKAPIRGCPFLRAMKSKKRESVELALPDGRVLLVAVDPITEKGEVAGAVHNILDVTGRKRAEGALRAAKEYSERIIETANVIIVGLDGKGNIVVFNDAARRITGYTRGELKGRNWFEVVVPRKRYPQVWKEFEKLQKAGRIIDAFENPILTKKGEERMISWRNGTVRLDDGSLGTLSFGMDVTGMRGAERALKESEARYRALVEESPYPTLLIGLNGRILLASDGIKKVLGYSPKEMEGKPFREFVLLESLPTALKAFLDAQRKPYAYPITLKVRARSGAVKLLEMWGGPFREHDKLAGVHVVASDITGIKEAEKDVRASEERLRTIFEGSSDAILVADAKTRRFTDCNKQAERLLGYPKSKILAMGVNDIHPKDELEKVGATFARMARGSNETLDTLIVRRDGKRVPVGITSAAVTLKGRKALIGSFRDLTERKQAEEALAASEAKYRSLVENASVGVFESDLAGNILYFNRMLKALSGYSDAELERMNAAMLYDDPQQRKAILSELESRGRFDPTEVLMHDKRGEDVWLLMSAVMVGNAIQGTAVNITDRKKAEQELKEAFEKLKTLDELKTDFVQMVSHELRTPLSSMRLASDLMAKELSPEEDREAHGIMRRNTDRMERIVSTVLNFSAIESGRVKYAHAPVDASALAREAADNARTEAAAKGVSLEFKEGSVPPVLGDAFWLGIAVGNLVENAVKFTERGGVTVETMRRGKRVLVRVRDTGLGLDKGNLETAFQKFTKAHPNIEGSGIGLWMSKRIAEAHRGDVTLKSAGRGKGTTAELWLPAKGI